MLLAQIVAAGTHLVDHVPSKHLVVYARAFHSMQEPGKHIIVQDKLLQAGCLIAR